MTNLECLATGSSGNCYILKINDFTCILDAGCRWDKLVANVNLNDIDFAFISHEHKDHSLNYEKLRLRGVLCLDGINTQKCTKNQKYGINKGIYELWRIPIQHGETNNCALIIVYEDECVLYATDFNLCEYDLSGFKFTRIIVECNYLEEKIKGHEDMKSIRQINTHMGLEGLKIFLDELDLTCCKEIDLVHLSSDYGDKIIMGSTIYSKYKIKTGVCLKHGGVEYYGG